MRRGWARVCKGELTGDPYVSLLSGCRGQMCPLGIDIDNCGPHTGHREKGNVLHALTLGYSLPRASFPVTFMELHKAPLPLTPVSPTWSPNPSQGKLC